MNIIKDKLTEPNKAVLFVANPSSMQVKFVFSIIFCRLIVLLSGNLKAHMEGVHLKIESDCHRCRQEFSNVSNFKRHAKNCLSQIIECDICKAEFISEDILKSHRREQVHFPSKCSQCDKKFVDNIDHNYRNIVDKPLRSFLKIQKFEVDSSCSILWKPKFSRKKIKF